MTDEQRDPAAELRAFFDALQRAGEALLEHYRPLFELIRKITADPGVQAAIAAKPIAQIAEYRVCHCLCGKMHPGDKGICDAFNPVTTRRLRTTLLGPVDVPLCAPCAAAQFLAEVT